MSDKLAPDVDWSHPEQWQTVYAPSSDTFFPCDGISALQHRFHAFSVVLEITSGSGSVTVHTHRLLRSIGKVSAHFATEINRQCCSRTRAL
jgi:hypothetical protein